MRPVANGLLTDDQCGDSGERDVTKPLAVDKHERKLFAPRGICFRFW